MIRVYGLKNCDTCRKAVSWLDERQIPYRFVDIRKDGLGDVEAWIAELGHDLLVNRRGTTWRKLPESEKSGLDADRAAALIRAEPAVMKRPVFDLGNRVFVGFSESGKSTLAAACDSGESPG